jgi:hypothetical protein
LKPSNRSAVLALRFLSRTGRWRSCVAWGAAVALILPSIAVLPVASTGFEDGAAHPHHAGHLHAEREHTTDGGSRLSDIPGSPTHPINHDCAPCQVIKYLATSYLTQAEPAPLPSGPVGAPPSDRSHPPQNGARVTVSPPIRAPPHRFV